jgi:Protein of unknown function (DUF3892)
MATQIVATNVELVTTPNTGGEHRHIKEVKTAAGRVLTRSEVVARINAGTEEFYTNVDGKQADVIVVGCPLCTSKQYIKTTADGTIANNLLNLPSFTP